MLTVLATLLGLGVFAAIVIFPVAMGMLASISPRLPDWVCRCGYPLVGLPVAGACPECGLVYNQHAWEPWTPDVSSSERGLLRASPVHVGLIALTIGLLFLNRATFGFGLVLLVVSVAAAAAPAIALSVLTPPRLSRRAAWTIALVGPIVGSVIGVIGFVESANAPGAQAGNEMFFSVIFAGGLSGTCSGIVAIAAAFPALRRQKRMLAARRAAVQTARRAAKSRAAASTSALYPDKPS